MTERVYKLMRQSEWQQAERDRVFEGSPDDRRDGFIHFSTAGQVRGTFRKYFAAEAEAMLVGFEARSFGSELKWEMSRNGEKFPHLYATLNMADAISIAPIRRGADGEAVFPSEIS